MPAPPTAGATVIVALVLLLALAGCGGGDSTAKRPAAAPARFAGPAANKPFPAKPLALRDYQGHRVDLADYRGKAVVVTFIYTHCPDVCPLIVGNLHAAQSQLGAGARKLKIIAVSTDPRGDSPKAVAAFLRAHEMTGRMKYLIGSKTELERVWQSWGIVARHAKANPELVEHSAEIFGIGASGRVYTLYPANFKPAWLEHDAPLLARS